MLGYDEGPSAVRYPRGTGTDRLPESRSPIVKGVSEVLMDAGGRLDLTILAIGSSVAASWQVAQELSAAGKRVAIVNMRFLKPLDTARVAELSTRSSAMVTVEEGSPSGGLGQTMAAFLLEQTNRIPRFKHFSLPDAFVEHGAVDLLHRDVGLNATGLREEIEAWVSARG
jgi:1-deoxy-D-xylulose-5-phosphate synthase